MPPELPCYHYSCLRPTQCHLDYCSGLLTDAYGFVLGDDEQAHFHTGHADSAKT